MRERAAALAVATFGEQSGAGLVNLAALALESGGVPPTWLVRPSAADTIDSTDLRSIPSTAPRLLCAPGIAEARRPETGEALWGDVASLGWYRVDDVYYLIGVRYPDGYVVASWRPRWTGADVLDQFRSEDDNPLINDRVAHGEFARQAARFLTLLGVLADLDPSPLRIEIDKAERREGRRVSHVYERARVPGKPPAGMADRVAISGYVRRQRFGAGLAQEKLIYVAGYHAQRWFSPRVTVERATTVNSSAMACERCGQVVPVGHGEVWHVDRFAADGSISPRWGWLCTHRREEECVRVPTA